MLEAFKKSEPVYPFKNRCSHLFRILGNIGSGDRLDFTLVGNGVNFAEAIGGSL